MCIRAYASMLPFCTILLPVVHKQVFKTMKKNIHNSWNILEVIHIYIVFAYLYRIFVHRKWLCSSIFMCIAQCNLPYHAQICYYYTQQKYTNSVTKYNHDKLYRFTKMVFFYIHKYFKYIARVLECIRIALYVYINLVIHCNKNKS
jgi:hypothetical protein